MKSPSQFIVEPLDGKRYVNSKKIADIDFIINTSEENHLSSTRYAVVVKTPFTYQGPIEEGDILIVHHNVFKYYNDMYGRRQSGKSYFMDNLFFIDDEQYYLYHHNGKWHPHDRYCFVKPLKTQESVIYKNVEHEPLMGIMKYPNTYLKTQGINEGDLVAFRPDTEYEFLIDGEKLYRMYDHQIAIKFTTV